MPDQRGSQIGPDDFHLAAHLFEPSALTLARDYRGLTKADLASRIGKTAGALSQFESGRTKPDARTVASLSFTLGFPAGFFARSGNAAPITIDNCHFRSMRSAGQRDRRRVLAKGRLLCDLIEVLAEEVEFPADQISPLAQAVGTYEDIELCADAVRQAWGMGMGPIPHLMRLLESKGAILFLVPDDCREVDAFSTNSGGRPLIFLAGIKESTSRRRFDAAHELGHLIMHADALPGDKQLETQAHRFAGAFLIPREAFVREFPRRLDWGHLYEMKRRWHVSVAAIVRRAYDLECITEATYRRAWVHLNQTGERKKEPFEPPAEQPTMLCKSLSLLDGDSPFDDLCTRLCVRPAELRMLVTEVEQFQPLGSDDMPEVGAKHTGFFHPDEAL